uniref:Uncharacterized protein n=1 Tax=Nelumbo nucifera TaxID=4432 RepID=A0A822XEJ6_NELNU|nr:TPA_asm: hypothetical protein HUJ06_019536 [Nelumbo nucifera]
MGEEEAKGGLVVPDQVSAEEEEKGNRGMGPLIFKRAMQYAKEYDEQQKELIQLKHESKLKGGFYVNLEARKTLKLLRLRQIFNGVSLKVNKARMNMLHRGYHYGKLNKQRIALNDDSIIEQANNFLWPFKLKKSIHYVEGGDARNREDYINLVGWLYFQFTGRND